MEIDTPDAEAAVHERLASIEGFRGVTRHRGRTILSFDAPVQEDYVKLVATTAVAVRRAAIEPVPTEMELLRAEVRELRRAISEHLAVRA